MTSKSRPFSILSVVVVRQLQNKIQTAVAVDDISRHMQKQVSHDN